MLSSVINGGKREGWTGGSWRIDSPGREKKKKKKKEEEKKKKEALKLRKSPAWHPS